MHRGAWWAAVFGVAQSWTKLKRLSSSSSSKQEMAIVNVDILGINELKWTGMGEFNRDNHDIYYCGQESFRRNRVAIIVNKRVQKVVLGCNLKNDRMISVRFLGKPLNITVIQVYA